MKKLILLMINCILNFILIAQDITISFQPKVSGTPIDSIWVLNQRTNQAIKLTGNESLILTKATGTSLVGDGQIPGILYPNPSNGGVTLSFTSVASGVVQVEVYNALGLLLASSWQDLKQGRHNYRINFQGQVCTLFRFLKTMVF